MSARHSYVLAHLAERGSADQERVALPRRGADYGLPNWQPTRPTCGAQHRAAVFDDVSVNSSVEHVVRGIAIDTGEVVWCVEFDAGAVEFLGGIAAAGPVVGALVLEPTTGEDVSDVDDAASDAVSFGIGIPPTQADALELSTASGGQFNKRSGVSVSRDDSVVREDNVAG